MKYEFKYQEERKLVTVSRKTDKKGIILTQLNNIGPMTADFLRILVEDANRADDAEAELDEATTALSVAKLAVERGASLNAHVAANGPTLGDVIDRALRLREVRHAAASNAST